MKNPKEANIAIITDVSMLPEPGSMYANVGRGVIAKNKNINDKYFNPFFIIFLSYSETLPEIPYITVKFNNKFPVYLYFIIKKTDINVNNVIKV